MDNNNSEELSEFKEQLDLKCKQIEAEREEMKKFLVMKSTEQQKKEGVERPVDTAYVEEQGGKLVLKALFDVKDFQPEEVQVKVENRQLLVNAQGLDEREGGVYRKTMIRKIDLPDNVDTSTLDTDIDVDGILTVVMPFNMPTKSTTPPGPALVPIIVDNGRRQIRLQFNIGPDFTLDDVKVTASGSTLLVQASYDAEIGLDAKQVTRHELKKEFRLPEHIEVDEVLHALSPAGILDVQILIKDAPQLYRCHVTTEDVTGKMQHMAASRHN